MSLFKAEEFFGLHYFLPKGLSWKYTILYMCGSGFKNLFPFHVTFFYYYEDHSRECDKNQSKGSEGTNTVSLSSFRIVERAICWNASLCGLQQILYRPSYHKMRIAISMARNRLADLKRAIKFKEPDSAMEETPHVSLLRFIEIQPEKKKSRPERLCPQLCHTTTSTVLHERLYENQKPHKYPSSAFFGNQFSHTSMVYTHCW